MDHLGSVEELGEVVVAKFGGASMSNMREVVAVIRSLQQRGHRVIAICSALEGMTDVLKGLGERAAREWPPEWDRKIWGQSNPYITAHHDQLRKLIPLPSRTEKYLRDMIKTSSGQLRRNLESINDVGEFSPTIHGKVLGNGELSSTPMLAALLGDHARYEHSRQLFITNRDGCLLPEYTYYLLQELYDDWQKNDPPDRALVLAGYVGKSPDGLLTVTDRGGTDTWAVHAGIALKRRGVKTVLLFKRGPGGIESSDYRIVNGTRTYIWVTVEELDELVNGGAKVVAPTAVSAALNEDIRIWVGTSESPQNPGTWILRDPPMQTSHTLRMITAQKGLTLFNITPHEGVRVGGKVLNALDQEGIDYQIVSGVRNMRQMSLTTLTAQATKARTLINHALQIELFHEHVSIVRRDGMARLSGIGEFMAGHHGVSEKFYRGIKAGGANVIVQVQCSNERLITAVVVEGEVAGALQGVHDEFKLHEPNGDTHDITHTS